MPKIETWKCDLCGHETDDPSRLDDPFWQAWTMSNCLAPITRCLRSTSLPRHDLITSVFLCANCVKSFGVKVERDKNGPTKVTQPTSPGNFLKALFGVKNRERQ